MSTPQQVADYYSNFHPPEVDENGNPATKVMKENYKKSFEKQHGPPPEPPTIPGSSSPGGGLPAARFGDLCSHGGMITGPCAQSVKIGHKYAARGKSSEGDKASCPMFTGLTPHVSGTILKGSSTVLIENLPAARVSDPVGPPNAPCVGNQIALGDFTVLIGDLSAGGGGSGAGAGNVSGVSSQVQTLIAAKQSGTPFCEVCEGVATDTLGRTQSPPASRQPPDKPHVDTCELKTMTVKCGHVQRAYVLIVGEKGHTGRPMRSLDVVAGPEGDSVEITTQLAKQYCPEHLKRPISCSQGGISLRNVAPLSATGALLAKPPQSFIDAFYGNGVRLLWPSTYDAMSYQVSGGSCGPEEQVEIRCYPAIKAELGFQLSFSSDIEPSGGGGSKGGQSQSLTTSVRAMVEFGKQKRELTAEFQRHVETALSLVTGAKNLTDKFSSLLTKLGNIRGKVFWPSLSLEGSWERKEITGTPRTGLNAEFTVGADPLIGAELTVNFLDALLQLFPPLTAVIQAKDRLEQGLGLEIGAFIKLSGKISATGKLSRTVERSDWKRSGEVGGEVVGSIYGGIEQTGEKKFMEFTVGGRLTIEGSGKIWADDHGLGLRDAIVRSDGAELFAVAVVKLSSQFRLAPDLSYEKSKQTDILSFEWKPGRLNAHEPTA